MKCEQHLNFLIKSEENSFAQRHPSAKLANQASAIFHNRLERDPRNKGTPAEVLILIKSAVNSKNSSMSLCRPFILESSV